VNDGRVQGLALVLVGFIDEHAEKLAFALDLHRETPLPIGATVI
jgi:hypothetical protein